jgi:hypothetical protein
VILAFVSNCIIFLPWSFQADTIPLESPVKRIPLQMSIPLILVEWAEKSDCFTPTSLLLLPFSILQISTRPLERPIATSFSLEFYFRYFNYHKKLFTAAFPSMILYFLPEKLDFHDSIFRVNLNLFFRFF